MFARAFRTIGIGLREYVATLSPTLCSTAVMVAAVMTIRAVAPASWPLAARFAAQVVIGASAFFAAALLIQRRRLTVLADFVRTVRS
jgi:hypothetical protein